MITRVDEDYFLNPPPGSAAARAVEMGIDLTLTLHNLHLTPEERIRRLDDRLAGIAKLHGTAKFPDWIDEATTTSESRAKDLMVIAELEAIQEWQLIRANKRPGEKLEN